jgi:hypothetical protein
MGRREQDVSAIDAMRLFARLTGAVIAVAVIIVASTAGYADGATLITAVIVLGVSVAGYLLIVPELFRALREARS